MGKKNRSNKKRAPAKHDDDDTSTAVGFDAKSIGQRYKELLSMATKQNLVDLSKGLEAMACALATTDKGIPSNPQVKTALAHLYGSTRVAEEARNLQRHLQSMEQLVIPSFSIRQDESAVLSQDQVNLIVDLLAVKSPFDSTHELQALQNRQMQSMRNGHAGANVQQGFDEASINSHFRYSETGYQQAVMQAKNMKDASTANDAGKRAWMARLKWTAELYWNRACELDPSAAKYWTNLSLTRIHLGRFLRSQVYGFRNLAHEMLQLAVANAKRAMKLDPNFRRAPMRCAQALLALGPFENALEASQVLSATKPDTPEMIKLQETAQFRAQCWMPMSKVKTIPQMLTAAVNQLKRAAVQGLAINIMSEDEAKEAIAAVLEASWGVRAATQLFYLRPHDWNKDSTTVSSNPKGDITNEFQWEIEIRKVGRILPLRMLELEPQLKMVAFMEGPWTMWGLDRLDRLVVDELAESCNDPCANDSKESNLAYEMLQRAGAGGAMGLQDISNVLDNVAGKQPTSFARDTSPNHVAAFSLALLQRIIVSSSFPSLSKEASQRVIDLYAEKNNGLFAGGEFLGMCMNCASGAGGYGISPNEERFQSFVLLDNALHAISHEIIQSNDMGGSYQQALTKISDWKSRSVRDISVVMHQYIFLAMNGDTHLEAKHYLPNATLILASILDSVPYLLDSFRGEASDDAQKDEDGSAPKWIAVVALILKKSAFGVFLMRRFKGYEEGLLEKKKAPSTFDTIESLCQGWYKMSKTKQSAYRWETYSQAEREAMPGMAPKDKADLFREQLNRSNEENRKAKQEEKNMPFDKPVPKLPQCASCGKRDGFGTVLSSCPCGIVKYCGGECQRTDWKGHRDLCRLARTQKEQEKQGCRVEPLVVD